MRDKLKKCQHETHMNEWETGNASSTETIFLAVSALSHLQQLNAYFNPILFTGVSSVWKCFAFNVDRGHQFIFLNSLFLRFLDPLPYFLKVALFDVEKISAVDNC